MTQDGLHDLGRNLRLVHQPVAKAVRKVMKAEAMSVRNSDTRLQGGPCNKDCGRRGTGLRRDPYFSTGHPLSFLWEVRSTLPSQRIARLILCFHEGTLVVLHGFIKKTRKTLADDLALAKRRMKEVTT
jgi:hypothetical protein